MTILISIALLLIAINTALNGIDNRKIKKQLKDIADNQFDAEEVMRLYNMKFNRPILTTEIPNIYEIKCSFELPFEVYKEMIDDRTDQDNFIREQLYRQYREQIKSHIEYVIDDDLQRCSKVINSRLRVVTK